MTQKVSNKRINPSPAAKQILVDEVDDLCPIPDCVDILHELKNNSYIVQFEVAHIYPLNPNSNEQIVLKNVEKLSEDVNHINNLIALCSKCHKRYDTDKTLEEYNDLLKIKKKLINKRMSKTSFKNYNIEKEIHEVLDILSNEEYSDNNNTQFSYDPKVIDDKLEDNINFIIKKTIKSHSLDYFSVIKSKLRDIEYLQPTKAESIALQVKLHYLDLKRQNTLTQEEIIEQLKLWLIKKTMKSSQSCEIIVSFFIQNCEVFE